MITVQKFLQALRQGDPANQQMQATVQKVYRIGVVQTVSPLTVLFDGEAVVTQALPLLGNYAPKVAHRVLCVQVGSTWVVQDRVGTTQSTQSLYKAANVVIANNDVTMKDVFSFTAANAAGVYEMSGLVIAMEGGGSSGSDFKMGLSFTGGATGSWDGGWIGAQTGTTDLTNTAMTAQAVQGAITAAIPAGYVGASWALLRVDVTVFMAAAGTVTFQMSQNAAVTQDLTIGRGSRMRFVDLS